MNLLVVSVIAMLGGASDECETFVEHLRRCEVRRLAILPEVFVEKEDGRIAFSPDAPHSRALAQRVCQRLNQLLGKTYSILDPQRIEEDIATWTDDDLQSDRTYVALAQTLGTGVISLLGKPQARGSLALRLRLYTARGRKGEMTLEVLPTLSDFAYAGRSFEVRRWNGPTLEIPGVVDLADRRMMLGMGPNYEAIQLRHLWQRSIEGGGRAHPLGEGGPPFSATFLVDGRPRQPEPHRGDLYLPLELGERLAIRLRQDMAESILLAIYVDGYNTFGQVAEHPQVTPPGRMWILRRKTDRDTVAGWHIVGADGKTEERPFVICQRGVQGAKKDRIGHRAGMITMIAYTNGVDGISDVSENDLQTSGNELFTNLCIGGDTARPVTLERFAGSKGLMLFAATVRYGSRAELAQHFGKGDTQRESLCVLPGEYRNLLQEDELSP